MNRFQRHTRALQMTFRGMDSSHTLRSQAEARLRKVIKQFGRISHCHVVLERPATEQSKAAEFSVCVQVHAEDHGGQTVAHAQHANATVAIRDAFLRLSTQLATRGTRLAYARRTMPAFATG